jgi:hypothetical protein
MTNPDVLFRPIVLLSCLIAASLFLFDGNSDCVGILLQKNELVAANVELEPGLNDFPLSTLMRQANLIMMLDCHESVFEGLVAQRL